jgi:hypothetical protein
MSELVEAVQRTRYGIKGGGASLLPGRGLRRRLGDWLLERGIFACECNQMPALHSDSVSTTRCLPYT